jgi:hypothetical protein
MNKAYLFYGTQLVDEFERVANFSLGRRIKDAHGQEIYNGGYVYAAWKNGQPYGWWRCDMTPMLLSHVPAELRTLALLLT